MKAGVIVIVALTLSGCSYQRRFELDRFFAAQSEIAERYFSGDPSEAKKALSDMIALESTRGRALKLYHGSDWGIALSYARLALIAEAERASDDATKYWGLAADAARNDLPALRDRNERVSAIRKFLYELERDRPPKWQKG